MNNLDKQYQSLLQDILDNGVEKKDRTGTGTISVFGRQIRHDMKTGFPLLTTKRIKFDLVVTELLWFLRGDTNIKYLVDHGCHIWDGDSYRSYSEKVQPWEPHLDQEMFINKIKTDAEFAKKWGSLGPVYGKQWRSWGGKQVSVIDGNVVTVINDQIANLINDLKTNPDSRRLMVNSWNPVEIDQMVLPPCHFSFQVYTRKLSFEERWSLYSDKHYDGNGLGMINTLDYLDDKNIPTRAISLMFNMRSNDVPLGLPFNLASYGLLLEIIGRMVNMIPDELIANLGDAHIYNNQVEGIKEQLTREPYELPALSISGEVNFDESIDDFLNSCDKDSFKLNGYKSHPPIKIPLSN